MASYTSRNGRVRTRIEVEGVKRTKTLPSMAAAKAWAARTTTEILAGNSGVVADLTLGDVLAEYARKVTPTKRGQRWETVRLEMLQRDPIAVTKLKNLDSRAVSEWRDRRLALVKPASVRREWNILAAAVGIAVREWKWMPRNPFAKEGGVRKPVDSPHRKELFTDLDLAALRSAAAEHPSPFYPRVMRTLDFALETAMRAGEIIYLGQHPEHVDTATRVAHLPKTKNGTERDVPLSTRAIECWNVARAEPAEGGVWGMNAAQRETHWKALRDLAAIGYPPVGRLHFHDARHTAITRLASGKVLQVMDLARMTGHKNLKELLTYYNESAASIALKLA